jgi:hypothetical protein
MVSVLTPRYIQSERCSRELDEFRKTLSAAGRLLVGDHPARVFKIVKTAVPLESTPGEIQALIGYEFFQLDPKGRPQELDEIYGPEAERECWARLNDLAYDIAELLDVLENPPETWGKPFVLKLADPAQPAIYNALWLALHRLDGKAARDLIAPSLDVSGKIGTTNSAALVQAICGRVKRGFTGEEVMTYFQHPTVADSLARPCGKELPQAQDRRRTGPPGRDC